MTAKNRQLITDDPLFLLCNAHSDIALNPPVVYLILFEHHAKFTEYALIPVYTA
jgi:hypothetical protein